MKSKIHSLIERAIEVEDKTYLFFNDLSANVLNEDFRKLLEELAQEEIEHRDLLKSIIDLDLEKHISKDMEAERNFDLLETNIIGLDSSTEEIMRFAIERSGAAYKFFKKFELASQSRDVRQVFEKISNLELALKNRLERLSKEFIVTKKQTLGR